MNAPRRAPFTHHLHVVIKLSKLCNLRCEYCFEYDQLGDPARMGPAQLRQLFINIRDYARTLLHEAEPFENGRGHDFASEACLRMKLLTRTAIISIAPMKT